MSSKKISIKYLIPLIAVSLILLISNMGQSFRDDTFLNDRAVEHANNLQAIWNKSNNQSQYYDLSSKYIIEYITNIGLKPYYPEGYSRDFITYMPSFKYPSILTVIDKRGKEIKKYNYGEDFFEFFRGNNNCGIVKGHADIIEKLPDKNILLNEIVLFDDYYDKNDEEIEKTDAFLKYNGATAVITPSHTLDLKSESGLYDQISNSSENPLVKFIVTRRVYTELTDFSKKGYTFKLQSGADIVLSNSKILAGKIDGKNTSYKPLVILTYYDGIYRNPYIKKEEYINYALPPSIILECMKSIDLQRNNQPDRTIIFVFLPGQMLNRVSDFKNTINISGDSLLFNMLGSSSEVILSYTNSSKFVAESVETFATKNNIEIVSKSTDNINPYNITQIKAINSINNNQINNKYLNNSGKFILSLIGDECYDLDFFTANFRNIRKVKRYVKYHSASISLIAFGIMLFAIFNDNGSKSIDKKK